MFDKQRKRLIRQEGWDTDELAQELYSMMDPGVPLDHNAGVTLNDNGQDAPLTLKGTAVGGKLIVIQDADGNEIASLKRNADGTVSFS